MNRAACVVAIVLAGCASEEAADPGGTNPPMLWLAMNTAGTQMSLVDVEPHPY
jgi:hypothetical protein